MPWLEFANHGDRATRHAHYGTAVVQPEHAPQMVFYAQRAASVTTSVGSFNDSPRNAQAGEQVLTSYGVKNTLLLFAHYGVSSEFLADSHIRLGFVLPNNSLDHLEFQLGATQISVGCCRFALHAS